MDISTELQRWNCEISEVRENTLLIRCPLPKHDDENPSCVVNLVDDDKPGFYCPVCKTGGNHYKLLSLVTGSPESSFRSIYEMKCRPINAKNIEVWHRNFVKTGFFTSNSQVAKRELTNRGLSDEIIAKYWLGYDNDKKSITIPILWGDRYVNVRRYRPGDRAKGVPKFSHYGKGYGKVPVLFPQDQLRYENIVLCGGEVKALAVADRMNQYNIGAVSGTNGEGAWSPELSLWLADKRVWICYDVDQAGIDGANTIAGMISGRAEWVGIVELPLEPEIYPTGDVNDYFTELGATPDDFKELLEQTEAWSGEVLAEALQVDSEEVPLAKLTGFSKPFNFETTAYISGVDDSVAHKLPRSVHVKCTGDAEVCSLCALQRRGGYVPSEGITSIIDGRDVNTLRILGADSQKQTLGWKEFFGIPSKCSKFVLTPSEELLTVRYALLSDTEADTDSPVPAHIVTDGSDLHYGEVCHLEGRADQSPVNTEEARLVTKHQPKDVLSQYVVDDFQELEKFRPAEETVASLDQKLASIYHDLERNVTFIYDRMKMHVLFDLTFHSPLWIPYANAIEPGWVSTLIVSETAQGKSTIMRRLLKHYGYGAYIDAANTTIAGLIGGVKTVGKRQFLKWGVLPQNDKRLVCIEEYANAPVELLRAMRAARDSGVVKLDKIDKGAAKARTRTIVLSNPKRVIPPDAVVDGIALLEELVQRPEDLRRFDIGMWAPKLEADEWHESNTPVYESDSCHSLITWAWTIPPEKIVFSPEAIECIRNSPLPQEYPYLYLIGGREFEVKLARLSAALAARVFSEEDGNLVVKECHVVWMERFLQELYAEEDFGYNMRLQSSKGLDDACNVDALVAVLREATNPFVVAQFCLNYNRYRADDLQASIGDKYTYETVYQQLLIMGCIVPEQEGRWNSAYLPTRRFKKILPQVKDRLKEFHSPPKYM